MFKWHTLVCYGAYCNGGFRAIIHHSVEYCPNIQRYAERHRFSLGAPVSSHAQGKLMKELGKMDPHWHTVLWWPCACSEAKWYKIKSIYIYIYIINTCQHNLAILVFHLLRPDKVLSNTAMRPDNKSMCPLACMKIRSHLDKTDHSKFLFL